MLFSFFLSGHMFPLNMLPEPWHTLVGWLPLQYLAYFPSAVFLGKVRGSQLAWGLSLQAMWILFFFATSRYLFQRGLRRYSAFGG
jgi:ABC-2 type transport system permease protein